MPMSLYTASRLHEQNNKQDNMFLEQMKAADAAPSNPRPEKVSMQEIEGSRPLTFAPEG